MICLSLGGTFRARATSISASFTACSSSNCFCSDPLLGGQLGLDALA